MVATLPSSLSTGHEPSGIEITQLLTAIDRLANYKLFMSHGGCTLSTTASSDVNVQGATWSMTKEGDALESDLLVVLGISAYVSAQPNIISFSVLDFGSNVTHATHYMYYNVASHHDMSWGLSRMKLLTPNTYTFQVVANVTGGATATMDSGDDVFALTLEIPL
jgi:hypothetical protein